MLGGKFSIKTFAFDVVTLVTCLLESPLDTSVIIFSISSPVPCPFKFLFSVKELRYDSKNYS